MDKPSATGGEPVKVHVPTGGFGVAEKHLANRLKSIKGARIGVLDNCKEFADIVLKGVADVLKREYGVGEIEFWQKPYPGAGAPFLGKMARSFDAVVNGVGH